MSPHRWEVQYDKQSRSKQVLLCSIVCKLGLPKRVNSLTRGSPISVATKFARILSLLSLHRLDFHSMVN